MRYRRHSYPTLAEAEAFECGVTVGSGEDVTSSSHRHPVTGSYLVVTDDYADDEEPETPEERAEQRALQRLHEFKEWSAPTLDKATRG